jgi:hypothetical protein
VCARFSRLKLPKPPQIIMNSKFIGYVAGLLVIDRQMKKCLAVVRTAGHQKKEHQASLS